MNGRHQARSRSGNMKAPDKLLCLEWVKKAWNTVTADVIVNSFRACGISSSMDGSDDSSINCLKPGGVTHSALETIAKETARLHSEGWDGEDPFTDVYKSELEDDEAIIEDE